MSTGCVVPLRCDKPIFCYIGSRGLAECDQPGKWSLEILRLRWELNPGYRENRQWDTFLFPLSYHDGYFLNYRLIMLCLNALALYPYCQEMTSTDYSILHRLSHYMNPYIQHVMWMMEGQNSENGLPDILLNKLEQVLLYSLWNSWISDALFLKWILLLYCYLILKINISFFNFIL